MTTRILIFLAIALTSACMRRTPPQAAPPVSEEKAARDECTRMIADTVKLRSIVTDSVRRDSLNARCRKGYMNIRVF